jgi:hypothetical protein
LLISHGETGEVEDPAIENPEMDAAVDDIVNKESDELLAMQDGTVAPPYVTAAPTFGTKFKRFFRAWWQNKWARYTTLIVLLAGIGTIAAVPATRYAILNTVGVRSSAKVIVLDDTTQLPLKNVMVTVGSHTAQTNRDGLATLHDLKLGKYELSVKRLAFASQARDITIGWGSNPLGNVSLKAVGTQYGIVVKDFLSSQPITGAEAESSDGINALSDKQGKIILTVGDTTVTSLPLTIKAAGYRAEAVTLTADSTKLTPINLVPSQKAVFVSKETGKYDVYSVDLDGKNKKLLLGGSGLESSTLSLAVNSDSTQAALVSTRDNVRDKDGYLLYTLTFINVGQGTAVTVDHAQQLQLVDWIGNKLMYRSTITGASAANSQRNRLVAYNFQANARTQLATANQFNTVLSAGDYLYYSASSNDPSAVLGLFRVKPDGSSRERLSTQEVWTGLHAAISSFSLQTSDGWYSYDLATKKIQPMPAPSNFVSFYFAPDSKDARTAWTDTRDGRGVLLLKRNGSDQVKTLVTQPGLTTPIRWANDKTLIYRVVTANESADYVVSSEGGTARKLSNVTATTNYVQAY